MNGNSTNLTEISFYMDQQLQNGTQEFDLDLGWMKNQGEWGTQAEPSKRGLTLADIQVGAYAETPEESRNLSGKPRGAVSRPGSMPIGNYTVRTKSEIWLENASFLYEEALQRQWSSATDVPWETIEPLPDDVEQAQCQMATFLTEVEFVAGDVPSRWVSQTSPDFYEARERAHGASHGRVATHGRIQKARSGEWWRLDAYNRCNSGFCRWYRPGP